MMCRTKMPVTILPMANWLTITGGNIGKLCGRFSYFQQIWNLNLSRNGITHVCKSTMEQIMDDNRVKWLDLSNNELSEIPGEIRKGHFQNIWLSGNRFDCNCKMLWMANWLANTTVRSGGHLVKDYKTVICSTGRFKGKPIYTLTATNTDCLPSVFPVWGIGLVSGAGVLIIGIIIVMISVARRWNEVKFWLYMHFDILNKNDDDLVKIQEFQFDALLSYR